MKVKVFGASGLSANSTIETEMNAWLRDNSGISISETKVSAAGTGGSFGGTPHLYVLVFYTEQAA